MTYLIIVSMICLVLSFYMLMILCCWLSQLVNFNIFSPYVNVNYHGLTWTLILRNLVVYELVLVVILNAMISQPPAAACSLPWVTEIRYLGIHITQSQLFKWSFDQAKRAFYRSLNAIFSKIGRFVSEEVNIQLVTHKCLPILLYGTEACPLNKSDLNSFDFAVNRFLMKLFKTNNISIIDDCRLFFNVSLPSSLIVTRTNRFILKLKQVDNLLCQIFSGC